MATKMSQKANEIIKKKKKMKGNGRKNASFKKKSSLYYYYYYYIVLLAVNCKIFNFSLLFLLKTYSHFSIV